MTIYIDNEEFRNLDFLPEIYIAKESGRVWDSATGRFRALSLYISNESGDHPYYSYRVAFSRNGIRYSYGVHQLVAYAFPDICGKHFEGAEVDHIDGNSTNNNSSNLRWCTHTENMNNPITKARKPNQSGANNPMYGHSWTDEQRNNCRQGQLNSEKKKLAVEKRCMAVLQYDLEGNFIMEFKSMSEAHRITGESIGNICMCCQGKLKQCNGFIWKYK